MGIMNFNDSVQYCMFLQFLQGFFLGYGFVLLLTDFFHKGISDIISIFIQSTQNQPIKKQPLPPIQRKTHPKTQKSQHSNRQQYNPKLNSQNINNKSIPTKMSNIKVFKVRFIADVKTVTLALKFPCIVSVFWKRGEKTAEIKQRKQIDKGMVTFNEKLEIQCNMNYDPIKDIFQQKKTKFTIVIFSDKGTKQAGQVYLDVAQLLNSKSKKIPIQRNLDKCPDKNAKLTLELSAYAAQEIKQDQISHKSNQGKSDLLGHGGNMSSIQPDFKKKRKQPVVIQGNQGQKPEQKPFKQVKTENTTSSTIAVTKENIPKVQLMVLEEQNKKLKNQLKLLKDLQIQNQSLKKQYQLGQKKACEYYNSKYEEIKLEYTQLKQKLEKLRGLQTHKQNLEKQLYENKDKMAAILNYAVLNKMNDLAEELTNIYSNDD